MVQNMIDSHNKKDYLQTLINHGVEAGNISLVEANKVQEQLFDLLGEIAKDHSNEEKITLSIERSVQLLSSICYQISFALTQNYEFEEQYQVLKIKPLRELYREGHQIICEMYDHVKIIYEEQKDTKLMVLSCSFKDTISKEMSEVLERYDTTFRAHETKSTFDYPLCRAIGESSGIGYVLEYLTSLATEERFIQRFDQKVIEELLYGYSKEYQKQCINIFEIVLHNVVGCLLLDKTRNDIFALEIDHIDQIKLEALLMEIGLFQLEEKVKADISIFVQNEFEDDLELLEYIYLCIPKVVRQSQQYAKNHMLHTFFVQKEKSMEQKVYQEYELKKRMSEEELGDFIYTCEEFTDTLDKISFIREHIKNIEDLMEVLSTCVYGEESKEIFAGLSDTELAILMVKVLANSESNDQYSENSIGWHMELLLFLNDLDSERRDQIQKKVGKMTKI